MFYTKPDVAKKLESILSKEGGMKAQVTLHILFKKKTMRSGTDEEVIEYKDAYFNSKAFIILNVDEIIDALNKSAEEILKSIASWISDGSGWTIDEILSHFVNIVKYLPLRGNSYLPLPLELRHHMKGLINPKNQDDKCFLWCHNRHLNPLKNNQERITQLDRESVKKLDYSGVTFPVTINQINRIEEQNKININVFGYDSEKNLSSLLKFQKNIIKII